MSFLMHRAAKFALILQIPMALACAEASDPAGPASEAARLSGLLTLSDLAEAGSGQAFRGAAPLAGARLDFVAAGVAVASATPGPTGGFSATLPPGSYLVSLAMSAGPPLEFLVELPLRGARFAAGRVDETPAGGFTLNVQVFNDGDGDAAPDDPFRVQILDLEAGDPESGVQDVVESADEAAASVTLCHVPPGNPDAAHTVEVGAPAVPAHLAHGDGEGACSDDGSEGGEDEDPDEETPEETPEDEEEAKVLLCHVPPGNPDAAHTIEVGASAVPAHLAHGDTEGACEGDEGSGEGDEAEEEEEGEGEETEEEVTVLLCHVPPGNPEAAHTIEVGESAVPAHLAHGDTEGECAEAAPEEDGEEEGEGEG